MYRTNRCSFLSAGLHIALIVALVWSVVWMPLPIASAAPEAEAALIGNWKFDETSGTTAADTSNYGNTGTVTNGVWAAGHNNNALSLNGTSSWVTIPNSASINSVTNRMTVAFWANATDLSAKWVTALQRSNAANNGFDWQLYLRADDAPTANRPVFRIDWDQDNWYDADEQVQGDIVLAANTWYHIAVTYDGTAMRFYIDGTQRGSTPHASSNIPNSSRAIWIGGNETWGEYFTGRLDEVYLYNRALSQAEIQTLMAGTQYTLTVNVVGSGSVIRNLAKAQYNAGEVVFLRSLPATNWAFSGWSGDLTGSGNPASITMNANRVITATFTDAGTSVQWTAYNDVVYNAAQANAATDPNGERVQYIAPNVTTYGIGTGFNGSTTGLLKDVTTGNNTPVTAAFTQSGGVAWEADTTSNWNGGYDTALGTDARNTFGGLADMVGTLRYGSSGWYVDLTFTGLNPARRYTFATTASRADNTYTNRSTRYTLSGANSATNASTAGANIIDNFNVAFNTGDNHANGYVARWTNIDPGADGTITVRAQAHDIATEYRAYAFDVFMLQEVAIGPVQQYTLTTNTVGSGSVTRNPNQAQYNDGTFVQLTAVPQSGYLFSSWSGDLSGSVNPANLTMTGNKVVTATFVTAPPPGPVTRFAAVADYGDASTNEQGVANLINSWNPEFVITMGDNSYGSATPVAPAISTIDHHVGRYFSSYIGAYIGGFGSGSAINRFFPSIGNHDYTDGGGINAYLNYFTLPGAGITTTNTSGNERYYDFVRGPLHFFAINSDPNESNGTSSNSAQAQWLQTQLAASTAPWKIVYFHHAPYSSGSVHGNSAWMQWPFQQWGADAVLSGHEHTYERILLNDFPYFVNGAGGHGLYTFNTPVPGSAVRYSTNYGAMLVEATSITMTFKFYSIASGGTLIDSYTIASSAPTDNGLVPADSAWRYLDDGSNQGTAWRASAFDDSSWASGAAPLGYGDPMATTVNCGPSAPTCNANNYITTYFRRSFDVADPSIYSDLQMGLRRDDGAVVYLNGTEVWRSNMNAGAVSYTTLAPTAVSSADETAFFTTTLPNTLVAGTNVLAVEIHQQAATSSDIGFDLRLLGNVGMPQYTLTTNTVGSGTIGRNPNAASYAMGTIVTLTATPNTGYMFSGWTGDLTGASNPTTITMSRNQVVTATFVPGVCVPFTEDFNSLTLGTRIGQVSGWTESGSASPAIVAGGLASTQGLGTGSSIFNWSAHPFIWTNPDVTSIKFQMDFQTNSSGAFDDDRLAWMTQNTPGNSEYNIGIQLDPDTDGTACPTGQNIETYWRNPAFSTNTADRVETTIACLPTLTTNSWYRAQLLITKLTNTSARFDVTLTALDGTGNPGAVVASGSVADTSTWPGGAAPASYFSPSGTSTALYPSYKNHTAATGNVDNAYADLCPAQYNLAVNTVGSGTVTKNPDQTQYVAGTVVTLTATPNAGFAFSGWSGDLSGSASPATITIDANKTVTATFTPIAYTLTVNTVGSGSASKNPNQATYLYGDVVTLTATAAPGWTFGGWSGDLSGSASPATITIDANKTVTATFTPIAYTLTVNTVGNGSVSKNPSQATYLYGQVVTLTATAATGWTFGGWSGDLSGSVNPATLTIDANKTVTATFSTTCEPVTGVDFLFAPTAPRVGQPVTFSASVTAGTVPITYTWNFGDGGNVITTTTVIQHIYPLTNTLQNYTATLTAANACSSQSTQKPIVVRPYGIYLPAVMRNP